MSWRTACRAASIKPAEQGHVIWRNNTPDVISSGYAYSKLEYRNGPGHHLIANEVPGLLAQKSSLRVVVAGSDSALLVICDKPWAVKLISADRDAHSA